MLTHLFNIAFYIILPCYLAWVFIDCGAETKKALRKKENETQE